jgi:hypothetical protein
MLRGISAAEDPAFGQGSFLQADSARVDFSISDLARRRQLAIDKLTLSSPEIILSRNPSGVWNWSTLGKTGHDTRSIASYVERAGLSVLALLSSTDTGRFSFEEATVRISDGSGSDSVYKNIALNVDLTRVQEGSAQRHATGTLRAQSDESDGAEALKTEMPFDLMVMPDTGWKIEGSVGPGPLETKNFHADQFKLDGRLFSGPASSQRNSGGDGHIAASVITIPSLNLSERVAAAARVSQIGDMSPGTTVGKLETDFSLAGDTVNTANLRIESLDGLGDATAAAGSFKTGPELTLNYEATITLSTSATSQLRTSANPLISAAVSVFADNRGLAVPLAISGDIRKPQVRVDVLRALGR